MGSRVIGRIAQLLALDLPQVDVPERLDQGADGINPSGSPAQGRHRKAVAQDATGFLFHRMPVRGGIFLEPRMQRMVDVADDQGWQCRSPFGTRRQDASKLRRRPQRRSFGPKPSVV